MARSNSCVLQLIRGLENNFSAELTGRRIQLPASSIMPKVSPRSGTFSMLGVVASRSAESLTPASPRIERDWLESHSALCLSSRVPSSAWSPPGGIWSRHVSVAGGWRGWFQNETIESTAGRHCGDSAFA